MFSPFQLNDFLECEHLTALELSELSFTLESTLNQTTALVPARSAEPSTTRGHGIAKKDRH